MRPPSPHRDSLYAAISQLEAERNLAHKIVARIAGDPAGDWLKDRIPQDWCAAGFAEEALDAARKLCAADPARSRSLAQLAMLIAGRLSHDIYPPLLVCRLEGQAWFCIGATYLMEHERSSASKAFAAAGTRFTQVAALKHEAAIIDLTIATLHLADGKEEEARALIGAASEVFVMMGDAERQLTARVLVAICAVLRGERDRVLSELDGIEDHARLLATGGCRLPGEIAEACPRIRREAHSPSGALPGILHQVAIASVLSDSVQDVWTGLDVTLEDLIELPGDAALKRIQSAGGYAPEIARGLIARADDQLDYDPPLSLCIAKLAMKTAESLDEMLYGSETVCFLRGSAYRQVALGLYYAARYPEAMDFFERADREFSGTLAATYESGRVATYRTIVDIVMDRHEDAMANARRSQRAFEMFPDDRRLASAKFAEGNVYYKLCEWKNALEIYTDIRDNLLPALDIEMQARLCGNIAGCHMGLGLIETAAKGFQLAARLYEQSGTRSEATRMRWALAMLAKNSGRIEESIVLYERVANELTAIGMVGEAAGARLDAAEVLIGIGDYTRAEECSRKAFAQYESSGMISTKRALSALAYLIESSRSSSATPETVKHVRSYLKRLRQEPALIFAPAPETPRSPEER